MDENFGKNLQKLLGGAGQMRENLEGMQKELAQLRVTGSAGGGVVSVVVNGERRVVKVTIDDDAMGDRDMLQDFIAAAMTDALKKVETAINEKMQASLSGSLRGMF
ncbi:MAG: YbaB/EbfC family nucleoid-associated protein [Proteobacteria bacterium]|nr:YbaB/EbfC family nucleoid-associated protein [Pseudomonadota bacterium]